jgi:hypothetical protein
LKLLLDEMYTGLKDHLEVMGWEVETVKEAGMSGSEDRRIAEYTSARAMDISLMSGWAGCRSMVASLLGCLLMSRWSGRGLIPLVRAHACC